jgi:hypothetical protein
MKTIILKEGLKGNLGSLSVIISTVFLSTYSLTYNKNVIFSNNSFPLGE